MSTEQHKGGKWKPGYCPNPKGRPKGSVGIPGKVRQALAKDIPDIVQRMVEAAKGGDVAAARLLLERTVPPLRAQGAAVAVDLTGSFVEAGQRLMVACGAGEIAPDTMALIINSLGTMARVQESDELTKRIETLERLMPSNQRVNDHEEH